MRFDPEAKTVDNDIQSETNSDTYGNVKPNSIDNSVAMEQSTESDLLSRSEPPGMAHENEFEKFARLISTVPECELSDLVRNVKVGEERSTENHLKASDPLIDYSADCSDF